MTTYQIPLRECDLDIDRWAAEFARAELNEEFWFDLDLIQHDYLFFELLHAKDAAECHMGYEFTWWGEVGRQKIFIIKRIK